MSEKFENAGLYYDYPEGEDFAIVGEKLGRWSEGGGSIGHRDWYEVVNKVEGFEKKFRKVFPDLPLKLQLIYGEIYG